MKGPALRDPPELRVTIITNHAGPTAGTQRDDRSATTTGAGPSPRPSGIIALAPGRAKITLRALYRDSSATAGWEQTTNSAWPGGSRGRRSEFKASDGQLSPANRPARKLEQTRGETYSNEPGQSLGQDRVGIRLRYLLSTAWRPPTKASVEKKKALTDLGRSIRVTVTGQTPIRTLCSILKKTAISDFSKSSPRTSKRRSFLATIA